MAEMHFITDFSSKLVENTNLRFDLSSIRGIKKSQKLIVHTAQHTKRDLAAEKQNFSQPKFALAYNKCSHTHKSYACKSTACGASRSVFASAASLVRRSVNIIHLAGSHLVERAAQI